MLYEVKNMTWKTTIKNNSDFSINSGFKIIDIEEGGIFNSCRLQYGQVFQLYYYYNKGPVPADLLFANKIFDLIHLANFINDKIPVYNLTEIDSDRKYIKYYDSLLKNELQKILNFLFTITDGKWIDFQDYYKGENLKKT